ncbi:uncharacterized protein LOC113210117 isoform X1 [Frankliniella occidentalis]|uniref:Uncharacterized protein LOC113210117 isoform X1 n=1 Tax=Frankliniella occidentalis TaxID=133901 RepID=A0A9C6XDL8_FRAOC|nr:uncharacterized protein LOC113210117 isoform X1 [Frankliniella occidentalis]
MSQPAGLHTCIRPLPASKGPVCGRPSTWSPPPPLLDPSTAIAREPYILPRTPGTSTVSRHLQSHEHLTMSTQTAMASAGVDECGIRATDAPVCSFYHTTGPETCWDTECPKCGPENRKLVEHPRPAKDESEDQPELPLKKKFKPNPTVAENQTSALSTAQPLQPSSVSSLELLSPSMSTVSTIGTGNDSLSGSDSTVTSTTPCNEGMTENGDIDVFLHGIVMCIKECRPQWLTQLLKHRRRTTAKWSPRYNALLEMRFALNFSKSKYLVMGLDYEREFAPFVSIENGKGRGVVLATKELFELNEPAWLQSVEEHFKDPSYQVRTRCTKRHELRCGMHDGKACVQISPLVGKGGYICLGESTWRTLVNLYSFAEKYLALIHLIRQDLPPYLMRLLSTLAYECGGHERTTLESIKDFLPQLFGVHVDVEINPFLNRETLQSANFLEAQFFSELLFVYPEMTSQLILYTLKKGLNDSRQ